MLIQDHEKTSFKCCRCGKKAVLDFDLNFYCKCCVLQLLSAIIHDLQRLEHEK
ncbi:MAG: hypothetical protein V1494_06850 [Candidatus Diapherotrites archaeon]